MKTTLLALVALTALASSAAASDDNRPVVDCHGQAPGNYVGGVAVYGKNFYLTASITDNYMSGRAVCEEINKNTILCAGLWKGWNRKAPRLEILIEKNEDGQIRATFNRPEFYGGAKVRLNCE